MSSQTVDTVASKPPPKRRRWLVVFGVAVALLGMAAGASLWFLDGDWLRAKLQAKARQSIGADLEIESVDFRPFRGRATLQGVRLRRTGESSRADLAVGRLDVELAVIPLLFRSVHVRRLEMEGPDLAIAAVRPASSTTRPAGITSGVRRLIEAATRPSADPSPRAEPPPRKRPPDWRVDLVRIRGGTVRYDVTGPDRPAFSALVTNVDYTGRGVAVNSIHRLLVGADVTADIDLGGTPARLVKSASARPAVFKLTGVDLGYLDRLLSQDDALVVRGGSMDLDYVGRGLKGGVRLSASLQNLELDVNRDAVEGDFMFIPAQRLIDRAAAKGRIELSFDVDAENTTASEDLRVLCREFWKGLLAEIAKGAARRAVKTDA
jgi:hypothetical protein